MSAGKESEGGGQELEGADEEVEADQRAEHLKQNLKKYWKISLTKYFFKKTVSISKDMSWFLELFKSSNF